MNNLGNNDIDVDPDNYQLKYDFTEDGRTEIEEMSEVINSFSQMLEIIEVTI